MYYNWLGTGANAFMKSKAEKLKADQEAMMNKVRMDQLREAILGSQEERGRARQIHPYTIEGLKQNLSSKSAQEQRLAQMFPIEYEQARSALEGGKTQRALAIQKLQQDMLYDQEKAARDSQAFSEDRGYKGQLQELTLAEKLQNLEAQGLISPEKARKARAEADREEFGLTSDFNKATNADRMELLKLQEIAQRIEAQGEQIPYDLAMKKQELENKIYSGEKGRFEAIREGMGVEQDSQMFPEKLRKARAEADRERQGVGIDFLKFGLDKDLNQKQLENYDSMIDLRDSQFGPLSKGAVEKAYAIIAQGRNTKPEDLVWAQQVVAAYEAMQRAGKISGGGSKPGLSTEDQVKEKLFKEGFGKALEDALAYDASWNPFKFIWGRPTTDPQKIRERYTPASDKASTKRNEAEEYVRKTTGGRSR